MAPPSFDPEKFIADAFDEETCAALGIRLIDNDTGAPH